MKNLVLLPIYSLLSRFVQSRFDIRESCMNFFRARVERHAGLALIICIICFPLLLDAQSLTYGGYFNLQNSATYTQSFNVTSEGSGSRGVAFSPDGLKMYVLNNTDDEVNQYNLSTAYDISTAQFNNQTLDLASEMGNPQGLAISSDGEHIYITEVATGTSDSVFQYNIPTAYAFDVSHATFFDALNVSAEELAPSGIAMSEDGSKMFIIGHAGLEVNQYALSTNFDVTTATHSGFFDVSGEEGASRGITFGQDGYRMYITGSDGDEINQYYLPTPYDVTTAQLTTTLTVSDQEGDPQGLAISAEGTKIYTIGTSDDEVDQYDINLGLEGFTETAANDGSVEGSLTIYLTGDSFTNAGGTLTETTDYTIDNLPSGLTPNLSVSSDGLSAILTLGSNATYDQNIYDVTDLQFTFENSAFTGNDASVIINTAGASSNVSIDFDDNPSIEYGEGYDLSLGASSSGVLGLRGEESNPTDITFSPDGLSMFVVGSGHDEVNQYDLSISYDVTTAQHNGKYDVSGQLKDPSGLAFNNDGSRMFIVGCWDVTQCNDDNVYQYDLSTPYDVTSAQYNSEFQNIANQIDFPQSISFNDDGSKMYIAGIVTGGFDIVIQYSLSTSFDVTSVVSHSSKSLSSDMTFPTGVTFSKDGTRMFLTDVNNENSDDRVYQYDLFVAFDVTTAQYSGNSIKVNREESNPDGVAFSTNGKRMFIVGAGGEEVNQYILNSMSFMENCTNDGSVEGELVIQVTGDTFSNSGGNLILDTHYSIDSIPDGLSPNLAVASDGKSAILTFSGNATDHLNKHDVNDLVFTFQNSAFTSGDISTMLNATNASSGSGIDFNDNPASCYANASDGQIQLNWGPATDGSVTKYRIYKEKYGDTEAVLTEITRTNDGTDTLYIDNSVDNDSLYLYRVVGLDASNNEIFLINDSGVPLTAQEGSVLNDDFGNMVSFDGEKDYIEIADDSLLRTDQGTVDFWVKMDNDPSGNPYSIAGKHTSNGSRNGWNVTHDTEELVLNMKKGNNANKVFSGRDLVDSKWHHIAFSYDVSGSGETVLYINGDSIGAVTTDAFSITSEVLRIGQSVGSFWSHFEGSVDEFRMWDHIKSHAEIRELAFSRSDGTEEGLVMVLNFDEPDGNVNFAYDGGKNGFNGELSGNADFVQRDNPIITYSSSSGGFSETSANDGSLKGSMDITIEGDTLTSSGGTLSEGSDYSINNLPSGLTPSIAVASDGLSATLTISGNAAAHENTNDVNDLQLTFGNSAFACGYAGRVENSISTNSGFGMNFSNNNPPVFNSSNILTFDENSTDIIVDVNANNGDTGANDDGITYSLGSDGADEALFSIDASTGVLTFQSTPDYENPQDGNTDNDYLIEILANDGGVQNNQANQIILLTVKNVDEDPVFTSPNTASIAENSTSVVIDVNANDGDGGPTDTNVTYSITTSGEGDLFSVDADNGELTFNSSPDFENPLDADSGNDYEITITADDGTNTTDQSITITVTDENDNSPVIIAGQSFSIEENASIATSVGIVEATDEDAGTTFSSWSISEGNSDNIFAIDETSGEITVSDDSNLDFETTESYSLTLTVSDGTNISDPETVEININDVNDNAPVITSGQSLNVDEDAANASLVGIVVGADGDSGTTFSNWTIKAGNTGNVFAIDGSTGEITVSDNSNLDFESTESYALTLTFSDGTNISDPETVEININDVNDNAPVITSGQSLNVDEDAANASLVGIVVGADGDSGTTFSNWTIKAGNTGNVFAIDGSTGEITVSDNSNLDFEVTESYTLTLTVSDGANISDPETVAININDVNDNSPVFTSSNAVDAAENTTSVVKVTAPDADMSSTVSYSITGGLDQSLFSINENTGELAFDSAPDFESPADDNTDNDYVVQVTASDGSNSTDQIITVSITDENDENPVFTSSDAVEVPENTTTVITVTATDADAESTIIYSLSGGTDQSLFTIDTNTGDLSFSSPPDFEHPADANTDNDYEVQITASDETNSTDQFLVVTVTNVNEEPIVVNSISDLDLSEGFNTQTVDLTGSFNDPDGDGLTLSASSDDETVVTVSISGNTLTLTEAGTGTANVTVIANDGNSGDVNDAFSVSVNATANNDPKLANPINDKVFEEGFVSTDLDLSAVFEDADGDALTITASTSNETVVTVSVAGSTLTITEAGNGTADITVTANDSKGGTVTDIFNISINAAGNNTPVVAIPVSDQNFEEGFGSEDLDLTDIFEDPDEDELTLSASSDNETIITVHVSGKTLTVTEVGIGIAQVTVTADDGKGGTTSDEFMVNVSEAVNEAPVITESIEDVSENEGFTALQINLANHFTDPENDNLIFSATSSKETVVTSVITGSTLTLSEVGPGTSLISVWASDGELKSDTIKFNFTVNQVLRIDNEIELTVYPNPAATFFSFNSRPDKNTHISLYDLDGRKVKSFKLKFDQNLFDISDLKPGTYLLIVKSNDQTYKEKLIKQ